MKKRKKKWAKILLIEILSVCPVMILPLAIRLSTSMTCPSFGEKANMAGNIILPFFFFIIPFLIYIQKYPKKLKIKKPVPMSRVERIVFADKVKAKKEKYEYRKSINRLKFLDNMMIVFIPFFAGYGNQLAFFIVVTPIIFFRLGYLIKVHKKMKKVQFAVHLFEKVIWMLFHSINLFFFVSEYLPNLNVDLEVKVKLCEVTLVLVIIGIVFELLIQLSWMCSAIYKKMKYYCCKNKVGIENGEDKCLERSCSVKGKASKE